MALKERCMLTSDSFSCSTIPIQRSRFCRFLGKKCSLYSPLAAKPQQQQEIRRSPGMNADHRWWAFGGMHSSTRLDGRSTLGSMFSGLRESRSKKSRYARLLVRVFGFLRSRRRLKSERRKQFYLALVSLGFRLFLISQADKISMLQALWSENRGLLDSDSKHHHAGKFLDEDDDHEVSSKSSSSSRSSFLTSFMLLCSALFAAALTSTLVLSPASMATLAWLVDCILSLAVVLSAGILTLWMIRTAVLAISTILKSFSWVLSEIQEVVASPSFGKSVAAGLLLLFSIPAVVYASFRSPASQALLHGLVLRARTLAVNIGCKLKNLQHSW